MKVIAIYTRKSVITDTGDSIGTQITLIKDYFKNYKCKFEIFEDEGFSGGNTNRPSFKLMMSRIKEFDTVAVYKIDRIARNIVDFFNIFNLLEENGVKLVSISEGFDPSTPGGKMMMTMLAGIAEMERMNIKQRVKDNMLQLAKGGKWSGGNAPIGYKAKRVIENGKECSYLEINEDEKPIVLDIYNLYLDGLSTRKIAKEMELPELTGTEKQVQWANTLRQKLIEKFDIDEKYFEMLKSEYDLAFENLKFEDVSTILDYILLNKTDAKYYIDNRLDDIDDYMKREMKEALKTETEIINEKSELEVKTESTVKPENAITDIPVEIILKEDKIQVKYEKNDDFRDLVKKLNYSWNGVWERKINELTGNIEDRAAELGNKLLNAGFPIIILDNDIREKAVNGIYEPECNRWIALRTEGDYKGQLAIKWWGKNDKLYKTARSLPGAHWNNGSMVLKAWHYKEVQDFANVLGFKFTKAALQAIEEYKKQTENVEIINPVKIENKEPKDGLAEILKSGSEILDDLKEG